MTSPQNDNPDNTRGQEQRGKNWPLGCFDANEWAKAFEALILDTATPLSFDLMRGWFANAIMTGYDHGKPPRKDLPETNGTGEHRCSEHMPFSVVCSKCGHSIKVSLLVREADKALLREILTALRQGRAYNSGLNKKIEERLK